MVLHEVHNELVSIVFSVKHILHGIDFNMNSQFIKSEVAYYVAYLCS